jgi:hypothetical protein
MLFQRSGFAVQRFILLLKSMKIIVVFLLLILSTSICWNSGYAQKIYAVSGGELIFSSGNFSGPATGKLPSSIRFTLFPHFSNYWNYDFSNHFGFFSGFSLRNIGMITQENDYSYEGKIYQNVKTKRRSLALGIPLALKLGSFSDHYFLYGGAQYEWLFHYKEKHFINDKKIKSTQWFSDQTRSFIPSFFAGIQFPHGINLRFTWVPEDFLNPEKFPQISKSQIYYLSMSYHMKTRDIRNNTHKEEPKNYASLN